MPDPARSEVPMTTVLLADDHTLLRKGVRSLLERSGKLRVVGEAADGRAAVQAVADLRPDVVIMDVAMPLLNGIEATRQIVAEYPRTKVVALSMHGNRRVVVEMLRAGAAAYVLKLSAFEEVTRAVEAAMAGESYLSPSVARLVVEEVVSHDQLSSPFVSLTSREREVVQLLAEGRNSKAIAEALDISVRTVDSHRKKVMDKLGLRSVADLTRYALSEGLVWTED